MEENGRVYFNRESHVKQISDMAYQIDNHQLIRVNINQLPEMDYDILYFDNSQNLKVPENCKKYVEKIDYTDSRIRLLVKKDMSNTILPDLLKEGFLLRSMRGIDND